MTAVFVDKNMTVVKVVPNMSPWSLAFAFKAHGVFELADYEGSSVKVGDRLTEVLHKVDIPTQKTTTSVVTASTAVNR